MTFVSTVPTSLVICSFFFYRYGARPDPHSFPTRRSSDLPCDSWHASHDGLTPVNTASKGEAELTGLKGSSRSEEHTSELQSQSKIVCRLLLEKKEHQLTSPPRPHIGILGA